MNHDFRDGYDAAHRQGKYVGVEHTPPNPHRPGTAPWADWFEGMTQGILEQLAAIRGVELDPFG